jgi:hypothetical protein
MSNTTLKHVDIDKKIIENEKINGFLDGMSNLNDAKGIVLKNAGFWHNGKYVSGIEHPEAVTENSIRQVSVDLGDGKTRYFKQVDWENGQPGGEHGNNSGLKVTAWQEIDAAGKPIKINGKQEIRITYTGYLADSTADTWALGQVMNNALNPQSLEAAEFIDRVIKKLGGKDNISDIIYTSHSFGAGQTLASDVISTAEGVKTEAILHIEPGVASGQKEALENALHNINSPFSKELQKLLHAENASEKTKHAISEQAIARLEADIKNRTTSIQAIGRDNYNFDGELHGSNVANTHPIGTGLPGKAGGITAFIAGGVTFIKDSVLQWSGWEKDSVVSNEHHHGNAPLGKVYLQEVIHDPNYVTTAKAGKLDPLHQLYPMVDQAKPGVYYEVVTTNSSDTQKLSTPTAKLPSAHKSII